jgi:hypothetical protein
MQQRPHELRVLLLQLAQQRVQDVFIQHGIQQRLVNLQCVLSVHAGTGFC